MPAPPVSQPDPRGRFGAYGGRYVPETLMDALRQLTACYEAARADPASRRQCDHQLRQYVRRPTPPYLAAINEALRDWMPTVTTTPYSIGSVVGPHPFPVLVRDFQSVIGREARAQCLEQLGRLPDVVLACVGGGSNSAGMFHPFVADDS